MSYWLDTTGKTTLGIGVCDRCHQKFPTVDLFPDGNSPGLRVCINDRDTLDPYRLPARQTENINLPFVRPDEDLSFVQAQCPIEVVATEVPEGLESEGNPAFGAPAALLVESVAAEEACDVLHYGLYGGKLLQFTISFEVTDPGVEVEVTWPDAPFTVDHWELYASYDGSDYVLIGAFPPGTQSYTDTHGYDARFGYIAVGIGENGERISSPAAVFTASAVTPPPVPPAADVRIVMFPDLFVFSQSPDFLLSALASVPITNGWPLVAGSDRDMMLWMNDLVYWVTGYGNGASVFYAEPDGVVQGSVPLAKDFGDGLTGLFPQSIRPQLGGGPSGRLWTGGFCPDPVVAFQTFAFITHMDGIANPSASAVEVTGYDRTIKAATVLDAWSWDGGLTVLLLMGIYNFNVFPSQYHEDVVLYDVFAGTFTILISSDDDETSGIGGTMVRRETGGVLYVAATIHNVLFSSDGIVWSKIVAPWLGAPSAPRIVVGTVGGVTAFVVSVSESKTIYYSLDGVSWTSVDPGIGMIMNDVVISNDMAIFVGRDEVSGASMVAAMQVLGTVAVVNTGLSAEPADCISIRQVN